MVFLFHFMMFLQPENSMLLDRYRHLFLLIFYVLEIVLIKIKT